MRTGLPFYTALMALGFVVGTSNAQDIVTLPGGGYSSAACGINKNSYVVGWAEFKGDNGFPIHAMFWNVGNYDQQQVTFVDLQTVSNLGGDNSFACAVNSPNPTGPLVVVGAAQKSNGDYQACKWTRDSNSRMTNRATSKSGAWTFTPLKGLGGSNSFAFGVNDKGGIVGEAYALGGQKCAVLWQNNKIDAQTINVLPTGKRGNSAAHCINNNGIIVGTYTLLGSSGQIQGFEADEQGNVLVQSLPTLGKNDGLDCIPYSLNDNGDIVGLSDTDDNMKHAFLYSDGKIRDLTPNPSGANSVAYAINNYKVIVGQYGPLQSAFVNVNGSFIGLDGVLNAYVGSVVYAVQNPKAGSNTVEFAGSYYFSTIGYGGSSQAYAARMILP